MRVYHVAHGVPVETKDGKRVFLSRAHEARMEELFDTATINRLVKHKHVTVTQQPGRGVGSASATPGEAAPASSSDTAGFVKPATRSSRRASKRKES